MKVIQFLKNHPKKSIFFSSLLGLGINYGKTKYEEECLMREFCNEARNYGEAALPSDEKERHVTVLLNPAANDGKAKSNYEKYCAPLLHLAGLKVALVRTEHEGQAKDIMGVMANTSAVVVAGGDGTLCEVLTGLLRREDSRTASKLYPIGILPLGENNTVASKIWGFSKTPLVKDLGEATMAIIKNYSQSLSVMEVRPIVESSEDAAKPIYSAAYLEWGAFRDAIERKSLYWYWARLKKYMVYVFSTYRDLAWNCKTNLEYSVPCSGCSRCNAYQNEDVQLQTENSQNMPRKWWQAFIPRTRIINKSDEDKIDYSNIHNDECGKMNAIQLESISDLRISTHNTQHTKDVPGHALTLQIGKKNLSSQDFIKEGWHREKTGHHNYETTMQVGEITIDPHEDARFNKEGKERELNIDNDSYEVKRMKIVPKPNAVKVFVMPHSNMELS